MDIIETAKNIIATYSNRKDCKALVSNAIRILKKEGVELFEEISTGTVFTTTRTLKASTEIRSLAPVFCDGHNVGHSVRKIREDQITGDLYAVGFRNEMIFKSL
ncbi:hypothetical protein VP501E541_P0152 [Vibrio phage 501E54-1]|nr:hypothetical protein VP501E541_P0152 [Vibrio phage 501E54-1]